MDYTPRELMVVCAARQIRNGEHVFVGMRLPLIAFALAKHTHAPDCVGLFETGILRDAPAAELLYTMGDSANITGALWATGTLNVMGLMAAGEVHLGFIGGAEIDRYGNLNTSMIGDWKHPKVRLPGSGGGADIAWRQRVGLPRGGPAALITTLAVFTFDSQDGEAILQSYHPGTTIGQVQEQTGWKLLLAPDCRETVPPSAEELRVIREYDPEGVWTR